MTPPASPAETAQSFDSLSRYLGTRVTLHHDSSTEIVVPAADYALNRDGRPSDLAILCAIDIATGVASSLGTDTPTATLTSDMSIDLLAEPEPGDLRTVGRILKTGKRIIMTDAVVTDSTGSTVAYATVGCAPVGQISSIGAMGGLERGHTFDLGIPGVDRMPVERQYDTSPADLGVGVPAPVASIELNAMTANPFGFLHGAVGGHLLLSGARRAGLKRVHSVTVRYLRPTTEGPADVLVDDTFGSFGSGDAVALKLSLVDRASGKIACAAQVSGSA